MLLVWRLGNKEQKIGNYHFLHRFLFIYLFFWLWLGGRAYDTIHASVFWFSVRTIHCLKENNREWQWKVLFYLEEAKWVTLKDGDTVRSCCNTLISPRHGPDMSLDKRCIIRLLLFSIKENSRVQTGCVTLRKTLNVFCNKTCVCLRPSC